MKTNTLCLRWSKEERREITKNYGRFLSETGELISLTDYIVLKTSKKLKFNFKLEERAFNEPRMQFQMNIPIELHNLMNQKAAEQKRSVNKLVISEII